MLRLLKGFLSRLNHAYLEIQRILLLAALMQDLTHICYSETVQIPKPTLESLRNNVRFYVNQEMKEGSIAHSIPLRGMCFHPNADWLREHRMDPQKQKHIEIYNVGDYLKDRVLWGTGGLLLHELSHAYHFTYCEEGFSNALVIEAFESAMNKNLYTFIERRELKQDEIYHVKEKGYACTNAMEYFAELSVAFLHNPKTECSENTCREFNKWFPYNRTQLREYDLNSFEMLKLIWWNGENAFEDELEYSDQVESKEAK